MPTPSSAVGDAPTLSRDHPLRVLSIQLNALGIGTISRLMREYFVNSSSCEFDAHWWDEDRDAATRLLGRLLVLDENWRKTWLRRQNLDYFRLRGEWRLALTARRLVQRRLGRRPDVLHFHGHNLGFACADLMARIPTVLQLDMTSVQYPAEGLPRTFLPNRRLEQRVFESAYCIAPWSEWAARSVIEDYGIDAAQVRVISPGVDLSRFPRPVPRAKKAPGERVRLLFAGYDFARKGGPDLLKVFRECFSDRAELHLMTSAAIDGPHPNVTVHRGVSAYTAPWLELYRQADIFVMPTHSDAMPVVLLEAMAAGLPVISSRLSAIPEMVGHGETGLLVTPGDTGELAQALEALIADADLRRRMGERGRQTVEAKFDHRVNFRQWEAVFQEAAHSAASSGVRDAGGRA